MWPPIRRVASYGETKAECAAVKPLCNAIADALDEGELPMPGGSSRLGGERKSERQREFDSLAAERNKYHTQSQDLEEEARGHRHAGEHLRQPGRARGAGIGTSGAHGHRRDHWPAVLNLPQPARVGGASCVRIESRENMGLRTQVRAADRMGRAESLLGPPNHYWDQLYTFRASCASIDEAVRLAQQVMMECQDLPGIAELRIISGRREADRYD